MSRSIDRRVAYIIIYTLKCDTCHISWLQCPHLHESMLYLHASLLIVLDAWFGNLLADYNIPMDIKETAMDREDDHVEGGTCTAATGETCGNNMSISSCVLSLYVNECLFKRLSGQNICHMIYHHLCPIL